MAGFNALTDFLGTYFSLSHLGRRYIVNLRKKSKKEGKTAYKKFLRDSWERKLLLRNFKICDQSFFRIVPDGIDSSTGKNRSRQYSRLIPFAWVSQAIRTRIFEAFALDYDRLAEERSVLQSFVHREWNDLIDECGVTVEELYSVRDPEKKHRPELDFVRHLWQNFDDLVPRKKFPIYFSLVDESPKIFARKATKENAREITTENGVFATRMALYVMRENIPHILEQVLPFFGLWLYSLDDLADLELDAKSGKITYISTADNPDQEIWSLYRACAEKIESAAPYPERILSYMKLLTQNVIDLRKNAVPIESQFFKDDENF